MILVRTLRRIRLAPKKEAHIFRKYQGWTGPNIDLDESQTVTSTESAAHSHVLEIVKGFRCMLQGFNQDTTTTSTQEPSLEKVPD